MQSMGVFEMSLLQTQKSGLMVHPGCKQPLAAADCLGDHVRCFVTGTQHQGCQRIAHADDFTLDQSSPGCIGGQVQRRRADRQLLVQW